MLAQVGPSGRPTSAMLRSRMTRTRVMTQPVMGPARPSFEEVAKAAVTITDRLGFARSLLREQIGVTPACGLAGTTPEWARIAIELAQQAADGFADDPDAI